MWKVITQSAVSVLNICFKTVHNEFNSFVGVDCFWKPGAYITHNATEPRGEIIRLHAAFSGATKVLIQLFSNMQLCYLRPVDTL